MKGLKLFYIQVLGLQVIAENYRAARFFQARFGFAWWRPIWIVFVYKFAKKSEVPRSSGAKALGLLCWMYRHWSHGIRKSWHCCWGHSCGRIYQKAVYFFLRPRWFAFRVVWSLKKPRCLMRFAQSVMRKSSLLRCLSLFFHSTLSAISVMWD